MSLTRLLVPTFTQMLTTLSGWLDKAATQMPGEAGEALPLARLAPDMFPLATQVRFACVQAYEAVHRLQGLPFPAAVQELLDEGRHAGERPGSLAAAQARIAETTALLAVLPGDALDRDADQALTHDLPSGMTFDLTAESYARDWALAQFYFHVMTAYTILRSQGVALGKADYVAHLLPFMRMDQASDQANAASPT